MNEPRLAAPSAIEAKVRRMAMMRKINLLFLSSSLYTPGWQIRNDNFEFLMIYTEL